MKMYQKVGFPEPAIVAMENFFFSLVSSLGQQGALKFHKSGPQWVSGLKAEDIPDDIKDRLRRALRRLYDNSVEQEWPPFYFYPADEPHGAGDRVKDAALVARLAKEVAPEMPIAMTIYGGLGPLEGFVDLQIYHMVHTTHDLESAQGLMKSIRKRGMKLHGISWLAATRDGFFDGRGPTMVLERAGHDGMTDWVQWPGWQVKRSEMNPYRFIQGTWKGGPWFVMDEDGRFWRSLPWIGVREGIDDSRYLRTALALADQARKSEDPTIRSSGRAAQARIKAIMMKVPFWGERNQKNYSSVAFDKRRRSLAHVAVRLQTALQRSNVSKK